MNYSKLLKVGKLIACLKSIPGGTDPYDGKPTTWFAYGVNVKLIATIMRRLVSRRGSTLNLHIPCPEGCP